MKKFLAGTVAAAMFLCPTFAYAEEAAASASDVDLVLSVTADDVNLVGTVNVQQDAEGDAALSLNVSIPAGESSISLDFSDALRVVDDTLYVNVGTIGNLAEMFFSASGIGQVLPAVGLESGWLEVSAPQLIIDEEALGQLMTMPEISEELLAAVYALAEPFAVEETETTYILNVNNDTIIALADKADDVVAEVSKIYDSIDPVEKLSALLHVVNLKETFADYIDAYAGGRTSVTGEEKQAVIDELYSYIDLIIDQVISEASEYSFDLSQLPDLSDLVTAALGEVEIAGQVIVSKDFTSITADIAITADGETGHLYLISNAIENGVSSMCSIVGPDETEYAASEFDATYDDENGLNVQFSVSQNGEEAFAASITGSYDESGLNGTATVSVSGTEVIRFMLWAAPDENGVSGDLAMNVYGEQILSGSFNVGTDENGFVGYLGLAAEDVVLDFNVTVPYTMDGFTVSVDVTQGEESHSMAVSGQLNEKEAPADLDITAPESFAKITDVIYNVTALYYSMQASEVENAAE